MKSELDKLIYITHQISATGGDFEFDDCGNNWTTGNITKSQFNQDCDTAQ